VFSHLATTCRSNTECCRQCHKCVLTIRLMGLYYRQLSATSRLVSTATSNASYCLRYWETQLGSTTLNNYGTVIVVSNSLKHRTSGVVLGPYGSDRENLFAIFSWVRDMTPSNFQIDISKKSLSLKVQSLSLLLILVLVGSPC